MARLVVVLAWLWLLTAFHEDQWQVPSFGALCERAGSSDEAGPILTMERLYWYSMSNNSSLTARPA